MAEEASTSTSHTMLVQVTTDGGIPKLHCPLCNKGLSSLAGYVKHVKKHEPPGGFKCRHCDAHFCQEDELKQHVKTAHTTLPCRLCSNVSFANAAEYCAHINEQHSGQDRKLYVCDKCGAEYRTWDSYKRHSETACGTQRPFQCDQCQMSFVTKYNLHHHEQSVHLGERRFCCSYCGKNFNQKSRLLEHERMHTGEKPYKCEVCSKCFAHRESLVTHSSVHTGIRLVECKCCAMRFSCHSNLIKHRRNRADSCGLAKYDPPKNRVRTQRTRLPASQQGTKAVNSKSKVDKRARKESNCNNSSPASTDGEQEFLSLTHDSDSEDDVPLASRLRVRTPQLKQETISNGLSDSEEEYPDFEPTNSNEEDDDDAEFKLPAPALIKEEVYDGDFEYQDASLFVQSECNVKEEGGGPATEIFINEKDKLLDVLLSTQESKPFENLKVEHAAAGILDEIAAVPIEAANEAENLEEDVLALKEPMTQAKEQQLFNSASEHEAEPLEKGKEPATTGKRKLRKRMRPTSPAANASTTKRVAKISKKELKERLKMLNKVEKSWKCPHCVKIYHIRKPYEKHLRDDHKLPEAEIKDLFEDADAHAKLDEDVFKCKICSKIYLVEKRLETHMKVHGKDGKLTFKCPCYCNLFFASKEEATGHAHKQHKELLYCQKCDKYMTGHDSLKNHEKNFHTKKQPRNLPRNLICDKCGKKFSGRTSLSDHVRSDCGRLPLYQCSVCGKRLSTAGILKTHMLLHQAETPYQCDICGKTFKVKAQYKSHLKTRHTDYKPYKCHLCPKEYPYRESLLTHMTVHTGIKRFLCNNCGKRFTCISNLQAHRKVHADTCGQLPLNAKATEYMGVQRGKLLMGAKPEAGMEYEETKTLIAQDVIDRDMPMAQELNFPSEPSAPLATVPLNYASAHLVPHIVLQTIQAETRRMH